MYYLGCPECGETVFGDKEVCPYCGFAGFGEYKRQKEHELNNLQDKLNARQPASGEAGGHAYVDLGLPSGTLWATCNIGAKAPMDYGKYFAWGETAPKKDWTCYNWENYKYCNGTHNSITKYCDRKQYGNKGFTDKLKALEPADDAAVALWGDEWRMPTYNDATELLQHCKCDIIRLNDFDVCRFTGSNGNYLLLPAAGHLGPIDDGIGKYGRYWLSSIGTSQPDYVWCIFSNSENCGLTDEHRRYGLTIRPVCVRTRPTSRTNQDTPGLKPIGPLTE
ncbi:MAG: hypothetical protein J6Y82_02745 [Bacteroidales bacterium]|nr:hypothetical protein [Bacteroidales bacterium]